MDVTRLFVGLADDAWRGNVYFAADKREKQQLTYVYYTGNFVMTMLV